MEIQAQQCGLSIGYWRLRCFKHTTMQQASDSEAVVVEESISCGTDNVSCIGLQSLTACLSKVHSAEYSSGKMFWLLSLWIWFGLQLQPHPLGGISWFILSVTGLHEIPHSFKRGSQRQGSQLHICADASLSILFSTMSILLTPGSIDVFEKRMSSSVSCVLEPQSERIVEGEISRGCSLLTTGSSRTISWAK